MRVRGGKKFDCAGQQRIKQRYDIQLASFRFISAKKTAWPNSRCVENKERRNYCPPPRGCFFGGGGGGGGGGG